MGYKRTELETNLVTMDVGKILNNLYFQQADKEEANEMLLSVYNGALMLVKQYQPNMVWKEQNNNEEEVPTTSYKFLSIVLLNPDDGTTPVDIPLGEGTWMFSCVIENTSSLDRSFAAHLYIDGGLQDTLSQTVIKGVETSVTFSGIIPIACAAGATLDIYIQASGSGLELRGTNKPNSFIVQKEIDPTAANEINKAQGNKKKVPIVKVSTNANNPTRNQIETALTNIGINLPMQTAQTFILKDGNNKWLCIWDEEDYLLEKMTVK